ncbi:hypothetical protein [Psychromonas aquatilis]|uniref:Uncharacterized protein n=1 Tax=Psychromonas aquatilis TaxID=2005072 RepID=A0ABU9GRJ4_9GAMM
MYKFNMICLKKEVSYKHSFIRTICNVLGQPGEKLAYKLFLLVDELCVNKNTQYSDIFTVKRFMRNNSYFTSDRLDQLSIFEEMGLICRNRSGVIFNRVLFNESNTWADAVINVSFKNNQLVVSNLSNNSFVIKKGVGVKQYIYSICNLQKRNSKKELYLDVVFNLFVENEKTGEAQFKTVENPNKISQELGFSREMIRNKLTKLLKTGLILKYKKPYIFLLSNNNDVNYKPSKYYINNELLTLNEYKGVSKVDRSFDIVIKKSTAIFTKKELK